LIVGKPIPCSTRHRVSLGDTGSGCLRACTHKSGSVIDVRFTPDATKLLRSSEMTRCANSGSRGVSRCEEGLEACRRSRPSCPARSDADDPDGNRSCRGRTGEDSGPRGGWRSRADSLHIGDPAAVGAADGEELNLTTCRYVTIGEPVVIGEAVVRVRGAGTLSRL
jgi:hypothetical protein